MQNQNDLLPFDEAKRELSKLCEQGSTGTLYLKNEKKRMAVIVIHKGDIIDVLYGIVRGVEALEQIRDSSEVKLTFHEGYLRSKPEVELTSRDKLFDKVRGKMSGSDEYLTKPFNRSQLMEKINKYLRN